MSQNVSSAAVVIGALRVKSTYKLRIDYDSVTISKNEDFVTNQLGYDFLSSGVRGQSFEQFKTLATNSR